MKPLRINRCPICGSTRVRRVKRDIVSNRPGGSYVARDIELEECGTCGERLFSPEALEAIERQRPGGKRRARKRSA